MFVSTAGTGAENVRMMALMLKLLKQLLASFNGVDAEVGAAIDGVVTGAITVLSLLHIR